MSKRLALIIGNSLYRDTTLSRLVAPDADVGALTDALLDPELGGFDDVKQLVNTASHIVRREIYNFFAKKTREDMLLFYFSGHGVLDDQGKLYLALKDTDTSALRGTAIPASYITNEMDSSRSKRQVLILDCCHSGAFARGSKGAPGASVGTASTFEGSGYGRVVLTASDATQYAWEGGKVIGQAESSLFTHFLVQGIQTGEADSNGDGQITVDELYDYVFSRVLDSTSKQTPGKWSFKEQGELIISRSAGFEKPSTISKEIPVIRREQDEQIEELYTKGLSAYWLEDWGVACEYFEAVLEISLGYLEVEEKLEEAREQKKKEDLYNQAVSSHDEGNLAAAINSIETLLAMDTGYKDAAEKLDKLKQEKELEDLSTQANQLFEKGMFEAVVKIIEKIKDKNPSYDDPEKLLARSNQEIRERKRLEKLEELYRQALHELNSGNLDQAKQKILQIEELEKGYKDTDKLLDKVNEILKEKLDKFEEELEFTTEQSGIEPEIEIQHIGDEKPFQKQKPTRFESKKKSIDEQVSPEIKVSTKLPKWIWGVGVLILVIGFVIGGAQLFGKEKPSNSTVPMAEGSENEILEHSTAPKEEEPGIDCMGASEGDEVSMLYQWSGQYEERFNEILAPLVEACGIVLRPESNYNLMNSRVQEGTIDIVFSWDTSLLQDHQQELKTMDSLGASKDAYVPGSIAPGVIGGRWLGLPVNTYIVTIIWYSPINFEELGYSVPTTWEELDTLVEQMVADGYVPWSMGIESGDATGWTASDFIQDILLVQRGPDYVMGLIDGSIPYNDEGVKQAYQTYGNWAMDPKYSVGGTQGTLSTFFIDAIYKPFSDSPEAMMVKQSDFAGGVIAGQSPEFVFGKNYDFFVVPGAEGMQVRSEWMISFSDSPAVQALVTYLSSAEGGANWAAAGFDVTPNKGGAGNYSDAYLQKKAEAFYNSEWLIPSISDAVFGHLAWTAIVDYLNGGDLDAALFAAAEAQAEALP